jgi:hypothetical protein
VQILEIALPYQASMFFVYSLSENLPRVRKMDAYAHGRKYAVFQDVVTHITLLPRDNPPHFPTLEELGCFPSRRK